MFDNKNRYIIRDYGKRSCFSSFLPGISGKMGIPVWTFYVNRGQGITSFGSGDKDHSIMEFYPAHQAYQITKRQGFRTFVKKDGAYLEPFSNENVGQTMYIGMNEFEIEECNKEEGIQTNVLYYTLPHENIGGLVREVTFKNISDSKMNLQILDGLPALIPYGVSLTDMKEMGQTVKAWMQVEDRESRTPYYRVRASIADSIAVQEIKEGNYGFAVTEDGDKLPVIVDPEVVFGYDTSLTEAVEFKEKELTDVLQIKQMAENNLPCCFFALEKELDSSESVTIYEVYGKAESKDILKEISDKCVGRDYFMKKHREAVTLTENLCKGIHTKTSNPVFDAYCKQTYLDNLLRGGYPIKIGTDKVFYLYSRKHGDIERDYNFFQMSPEFYSQGNANYRDINQNRRCDVLFTPYVEDLNIKTFYNLIQTDGYNPLQIQKAVYMVKPEKMDQFQSVIKEEAMNPLKEILRKPFTPGSLAFFAKTNHILREPGQDDHNLEQFISLVMDEAESAVNAAFGEGYWTDHWTYNLDLIETYVSLYPDKEETLLFDDISYTYYEAQAVVNKRQLRYEETERGIRQYHTLNHERKKGVEHVLVCTDYGKGNVYYGTLMEKLLLLCTVKFATLDLYGMGIEMEGGKPGWYDALNGLPGLLGSSMCETYELCRLLEYVTQIVKKYKRTIPCMEELYDLMTQLDESLNDKESWEDVVTWNVINDKKEAYREQTVFGVSGRKTELTVEELIRILKKFHKIVQSGIERALTLGQGISPAYFTYTISDYTKSDKGIEIKQAHAGIMPYFLEGPVRYMRLHIPENEKAKMYHKVKESDLYDKKLSMYKVNESLKDASFEIGRSKAFTPGWLENESIWLHMEYKYLLELLKSEMYEEFFTDFKNAAVPFLDPLVYGRSPLENSSFIASSANHNEKIHGKGFVARLSGSTAEFVEIWQIMMFGPSPFTMKNKELTLKIASALPGYLIDESKRIEATFLGSIPVTFYFKEIRDYYPGSYHARVQIEYSEGEVKEYADGIVSGEDAQRVRSGEAKKIEVFY